jgi:hypothetical protein
VVGAATAATVSAGDEWVRSLPDAFGPADALAALDRALDYARGAVLAVADQFHGTLPPPPWPAPPSLVKARDDASAMRDGFEVLTRKSPRVRWPLKLGKVGPALQRTGAKLYAEVAALQGRVDKLPKLDPKALLPSAAAALLSSPWVVLGLLYLLTRESSS